MHRSFRSCRAAALAIATACLLGAAGSAQAAFPGQNGKIVYSSSSNLISAIGPDGSGNQILAAVGNLSNYPQWSPDGTRIAFSSDRDDVQPTPCPPFCEPSPPNIELYVMNADGSGLRRLTNTPEIAEDHPTWSPDGTKIAYETPDFSGIHSDIYIADADGSGTPRRVTDSPYSDIQPNWSPKGDRIVFSSNRPQYPGGPFTQDIFLVNTDGSGERILFVGDFTHEMDPSWSPDGKMLAFTTQYAGGGPSSFAELALIPVDGTDILDMRTIGRGREPAWSPDGQKLVFTGDDGLYTGTLGGDRESPTLDGVSRLVAGGHSGDWGVATGPADADGDGILDGVDPAPSTASDDFADGDGNSGRILDRAGLAVSIADVASPDGLRVKVGAGTGQVTLRVCGGFTLKLNAGSEAVVTCGSVKVQVVTGAAQVVLGGGLTTVSVPAGVTAKVSEGPGGTFQVQNLAGGGEVTVVVDGVQTSVPPGTSKSVTAWDFRGFTSPVDNPTVLNVVKGGQAVPLKWRLVRADGTPVTTLTNARITVTSLACSLGAMPDQIEETSPGGSGLQNLGNGYYQLNWKTPKDYKGSCKTLQLDIGEGVTRDAYFRFSD